MDVGLNHGHTVLDGDPAPPPIFGPCLLWPNGRIDQDATWYGGLAVSWAATLCIHFGGSCPLTEFRHVQNSLRVQVLRSPILAALLHCSPTKVCGVVQGMELWNFRRGRHLYSAGRPSRWASAHILVLTVLTHLNVCSR